MTNRQVAMTCLLCADAVINVVEMCAGMPGNKEDAGRVIGIEQNIREFYEMLEAHEDNRFADKLVQMMEVV